MQDALGAGADDFVMKPFTAEVLLERLAMVGFEMQDGVA
jgi:DNA-binding response OmpR family regulator